MSFLLRPASRLPTALPRTLPASSRLLATSPVNQKTATETAKEKLDEANQKAGQIGVAGIDKGKSATDKIKEAVGLGAAKTQRAGEDAKKTTEGAATEAKRKAEDVAEEAKRKVSS